VIIEWKGKSVGTITGRETVATQSRKRVSESPAQQNTRNSGVRSAQQEWERRGILVAKTKRGDTRASRTKSMIEARTAGS